MLKENIVMLKGAISQFKDTGCFWESSQWAAKVLTHPLRQPNRKGMNIIEVGAGTGAVTVSVLENMLPEDRLVICEINPDFMRALKSRLEKSPLYQMNKERISFFSGPIQEFQTEEKFDFIICALPFLNFDLPLVKEIFAKFHDLSSETSMMTYFEYLGIRPVSKVLSPTQRKKRIREIDGFFAQTYSPRRIKTKTCWLNVLPMNVYTLDMAAAA